MLRMLAIAGVLGATTLASFSYTGDKSKVDEKKLVGVWQLVNGPASGVKVGVEFTGVHKAIDREWTNGKSTNTHDLGDWALQGNELRIVHFVDGNPKVNACKIIYLSDSHMTQRSLDGKTELEFDRLKEPMTK